MAAWRLKSSGLAVSQQDRVAWHSLGCRSKEGAQTELSQQERRELCACGSGHWAGVALGGYHPVQAGFAQLLSAFLLGLSQKSCGLNKMEKGFLKLSVSELMGKASS